MDLEVGSAAILGCHWVHDIVTAEGAFGPWFAAEVERNNVIPATARLFEAARSRGVPVVYTRVCFQPGHSDLVVNNPLFGACQEYGALLDGSRGADIIPELQPGPDDLVVSGNRVNGFVNSSLDFVLRSRNVRTVILTGVATNITIESTARLATDLGYRAIVLSDCVSTNSAEAQDAALANLGLLAEVSTSGDIIKALEL